MAESKSKTEPDATGPDAAQIRVNPESQPLVDIISWSGLEARWAGEKFSPGQVGPVVSRGVSIRGCGESVERAGPASLSLNHVRKLFTRSFINE